MLVSITLVAFKAAEKDMYCSYCPELMYFYDDATVEKMVENLKRHLYQELCHRLRYKNLIKRGWKISENSAIPPIFVDEEAIRLTERSYEVTIKEPIIIKVDVELPSTRNLW